MKYVNGKTKVIIDGKDVSSHVSKTSQDRDPNGIATVVVTLLLDRQHVDHDGTVVYIVGDDVR